MILHPLGSTSDIRRLSFEERGKHLHKLLKITIMLRKKLWSGILLGTTSTKRSLDGEPPRTPIPPTSPIFLASIDFPLDYDSLDGEYFKTLEDLAVKEKGATRKRWSGFIIWGWVKVWRVHHLRGAKIWRKHHITGCFIAYIFYAFPCIYSFLMILITNLLDVNILHE